MDEPENTVTAETVGTSSSRCTIEFGSTTINTAITTTTTPMAMDDAKYTMGIILFHGSWNRLQSNRMNALVARLEDSAITKQGYNNSNNCRSFGCSIEVDQSDQSLETYIGETYNSHAVSIFSSIVPSELPVLSIYLNVKNDDSVGEEITTGCKNNNNNHINNRSKIGSIVQHHVVSNISSVDIIQYLTMKRKDTTSTTTVVSFDDTTQYVSKILRPVQQKVEELEEKYGIEYNDVFTSNSSSDAIRIFVAGDRSSVGKSSMCLGILGSLLVSGNYTPDTLAYIKPATQSESTQLIQLYCEKNGIHCVPIGPLVYYRGFTRAFLAGEAGTTSDWLRRCCTAVDRIARGKRVVIIDGVGFPSVGSICGTSNASVAVACGYPRLGNQREEQRHPMGVVLVGGSGVGAAVDAFNLNAAYFENFGVPVMGGIFNKLAKDGFYSLTNCKEQISAYFDQSVEQIEKGRRPFGFVPLFPRIGGNHALDYVDEFIEMFRTHVDTDAIVDAAQRVRDSSSSHLDGTDRVEQIQGQKRMKLSSLITSHHPVTTVVTTIRSRQEIEVEAITAGAAPSA